MCSTFSWIISKSKFKSSFTNVLENVESDSLSEYNKLLIKERFIPMVNSIIVESYRSNLYYLILQGTTTIGSIIVPALLAFDETNFIYNSTSEQNLEYSHNLYWTIWAISLSVTLSNAISQLTNIEKKYIMRNIHSSQMKKEGWNFLQKTTDVYKKYKNKTHDSIINIFWERVERLRFKQVVSDLSYDHIDEINVSSSPIPTPDPYDFTTSL